MRGKLGLSFLFMFFVTTVFIHAELFAANDVPNASQTRLENRFVCMMNNKFFGKDQIPVQVGSKTYYGCCEGCKKSLAMDPSIRVSRDPYTGEEVDKADAFIVKKPNGSDEVLYFKSAQTYESFLAEHVDALANKVNSKKEE